MSIDRMLASPELETHDGLARAAAIGRIMVEERVGGHCWGPPPVGTPDGAVLLVAGSNPARTSEMLARVLAACPPARVVLLDLHGSAGPHLRKRAVRLGCRLIDYPVDIWPILDTASVIHVDDNAEIGFLALLNNRTVACHGRSWLAGWGLTEDHGVAQRHTSRTLVELSFAALIGTVEYCDPFSGAAIICETFLDYLVDWRRLSRTSSQISCFVGVSLWKRRRIIEFFSVGSTPGRFRGRFESSTDHAIAAARKGGGAIAAWPSRTPSDLVVKARAAGIPIFAIEDGFVRSVGLGADFLPPASIILDTSGIYFDPSTRSDLDSILLTHPFDDALRQRALRLIEMLIHNRVTKYNIDHGGCVAAAPPGVRRILVPGQVEDDRSVIAGGAGTLPGLPLLAKIRASNPDAHIMYKPHPDVEAGHRRGAIADAAVLAYANAVVRGVSMPLLIEAVDEVHTLTSLAGFEALLRGCKVVVYGQPFYAGWGLTEDHCPLLGRGRRLTLSELVAGCLILYPRYLDPLTLLPCGPEILIDRLADPTLWQPSIVMRLRRLQGWAVKGLRHVRPTVGLA